MNEKYYHGVRVQEENSELSTPLSGTVGVQVVVGTAPVNLTDNPEQAVNVPVLCRNMREAKEKLGYSNDFAAYTLCQSMYASFRTFAVAPVIFINVLDPKKHRTAAEENDYPVLNGQVRLDKKGILKSELTVKHGTTELTEQEDYLLHFDDAGSLTITLITDVADNEKLSIGFACIDPASVTKTDIIGGYDIVTGKESGLEVIRQVYPRTGIVPGLILAPGWSHITEVGAVMMSKCEGINGVFTAECLLDLNTATTKSASDVPKVKEDSVYQDKHAIVLWPKVIVGGQQAYYSAVYGAMAAYADAANDNVPSISPSNYRIRVTSAVTEDGTEVFLDREQANVLNANGIVTLINEGGWLAWGNNTSAYPASTDPKERWICYRRMFSWMANSLITTYHSKVDSPANFRLIESICDSENIRINSYVAAGKLAGGRIEYDEAVNTVENILSGQVVFHISIAAFTPAEDILFILKFDPELLSDSLSGAGGETA